MLSPRFKAILLVTGLIFGAAHLEGRRNPGNEALDSTWVRHATYEDFAGGQFGNSGHNIYVSRSGRVQTINRWDFNGDSYPDLLFTSDHDLTENAELLIYWGQAAGFDSLLPPFVRLQPMVELVRWLLDRNNAVSRLPAAGGGRCIVVDLDHNGYPEIVFTNYLHNYPGIRTAYIYWGSKEGYSAARRTELPTEWGTAVEAGDFNRDGYPDLVFANAGLEGARRLNPEKEYPSYIYWGGPEGFAPHNLSHLTTWGARDCTVSDWNGDGWLDIAFINRSALDESCLIYWGGPGGFSNENSQKFPVTSPTSMNGGDLNNDGFQDLVITTETAGVLLFFGDGRTLGDQPGQVLATGGAKDAIAEDLNGDGLVDLALASDIDDGCSVVYFGSADGFSEDNRQKLPTLRASSVSAGDLNDDGFVDLLFANSRDSSSHDVPSYIYWGSSTGFASYLRSDITGFGAVATAVADLDLSGRLDIVLVNQASGRTDARADSIVYWGNPHHYYSTASSTLIPNDGAHGSSTADLNDDGWADIVICNASREVDVYWGGPDGYAISRREELAVTRTTNSSVADFNRDGYLDLLFSYGRETESNERLGAYMGAYASRTKAAAAILWGGAEGFVKNKRTNLNLDIQTTLVHAVADFNKDGYLDVIFPDADENRSQIYWGSSSGLNESSMLDTPAAGIEVADLNNDGWLDLVLSGRKDPRTGSYQTSSAIYWGSSNGFEPNNSIRLPTFHSPENAVADLNGDGFLDLIFESYRSDTTRVLPVLIYWGNADYSYDVSNRSGLPAESSSGFQILDLNEDGFLDVVVHNHIKDASHATHSYIYWGRASGFSVSARTELPTFGPHHSQVVDAGNLYHRRFEEEYISSPIAAPAGRKFHRLHWKAEVPRASCIRFQIRSATSENTLNQAPWQGADGGFYSDSGARLSLVPPDHSWLQYRAVFQSDNGAAYPVLSEVAIECESLLQPSDLSLGLRVRTIDESRRDGRKFAISISSAVPAGTWTFNHPAVPAINRWAIFSRPSGPCAGERTLIGLL